MTETNLSSAPAAHPESPWDAIVAVIRTIPTTLRIVGTTLRLAWVSFALTIIGGLLFAVPEQSQDVIRATLIDIGNWRWEQLYHCLFFLGALALWALGTQIWARIMTMHPGAPRRFVRYDKETAADCVEAMPRLLGFSVFITIAMAVCCIVLETPLLVYLLVAVPFVPLLLTLVTVLKPRQSRKRVLFITVAAAGAIGCLPLAAYLSFWPTWHVPILAGLLVAPPLLMLAGTCLKLRMPERIESRALKLTIVFVIPVFLILAFAMEFSFQLEAANFQTKCEQAKQEDCQGEIGFLEDVGFNNAAMRFEMAEVKDINPSHIDGSVQTIAESIIRAIKRTWNHLEHNWGALIAVPFLFGLGIAWLLLAKNSLVDRWMKWNRAAWLEAANPAGDHPTQAAQTEPAATKPQVGRHAPIASNQRAARNHYWVLAVVYVAAGVAAYLLFLFSPVTAGRWLGPAAIIALFLPLVIAPLTLLSRWSLSWRFPMLTSVLAVLATIGFIFDQHYVRKLDGQLDNRTPYLKAFDLWKRDAAERSENGPRLPIVIVAAAGGGLRAAYWTATVLGKLHDKSNGEFSKSLFAISGVSGGALGASVYRALLARAERIEAAKEAGKTVPLAECEKDPKDPDRNDPRRARRLLTKCAQEILGRDSLAPALGSMLFTDVVHRVVPLPTVLAWFRDRDRAAALEESWEESWRLTLAPETPGGQGENLLGGSFLDLWKDKPYPALLLNGTSVLSGRRIITSNLSLDPPFPNAIDFLKQSPTPIRVSTAVNNSARFPVIGPAGTFEISNDAAEKQEEQVVDGGYFENFGATTALDLARALREKDKNLNVIFLQISSDPTLREDPEESSKLIASGSIGGDFLAPVLALANTRTSRGAYQSAVTKGELGDFFDSNSKESGYAHINMDISCGWGAPLGWTMSQRVRQSLTLDEMKEEDTAQRYLCSLRVLNNMGHIIAGILGKPELRPMGLITAAHR